MSEQILSDLGQSKSNRFSQYIILAKLKAAGIHLFISALIFFGLLACIVYIWYPFPHFDTDGGWQGVRIIAAVDLVLGPFLTLIIFNPRKSLKEKIIDFTFIGLVQAAALAWGINTAYSQRPVAMVYTNGSFYSVVTKHLQTQGIEIDALDALSPKRPAIVFSAVLTGEDEKNSLLLELNQDLSRHTHFHLFRPLASYLNEIAQEKLNIELLASADNIVAAQLEDFLNDNGAQAGDYIFVPFQGRYKNVILAMTHDGDITGRLSTSLAPAILRDEKALNGLATLNNTKSR